MKNVFKGKWVLANVNQSPAVHAFRTVIGEGSTGPPDFAGRYRIVEWGCGAPCISFAIVDKKTGYVYMVPATAILGVGYRLDSSLFIIDPPEIINEADQEGKSFTGGYSAVARMARTFYFVWDERKRQIKKIDGCNYSYGDVAEPKEKDVTR